MWGCYKTPVWGEAMVPNSIIVKFSGKVTAKWELVNNFNSISLDGKNNDSIRSPKTQFFKGSSAGNY
jgi:hypothetical protein